MRFEHTFTTPGDPDAIFGVLAQPAQVAPCLPGATLDAAPDRPLEAGDELSGQVELRVGPVKMRFASDVRVLEIDRSRRRTVLGIHATDERGNGSAEATISLGAEASDGGTVVTADVDLNVRGRVATFGSATIERVSQRVLEQFAANLAATFDPAQAPPAAGAPADDGLAVRATAAPAPSPALDLTSVLGSGTSLAWPVLATGFAFAAGVLAGRRQRPRARWWRLARSRRWS